MDEELARRLALETQDGVLRRGPQGRTRVRPAARLGQPYDLVKLYFPAGSLSLAPAPGTTVYANSVFIDFDPLVPLSPFSYLWPDILSYDVDDAALGGAFVSFLSLKLDDDSEVGLHGTQLICQPSGAVSVSGPTFNDVSGFVPGRSIKSARVRLQADGPGTATASLALGEVDLYLFRARKGRMIELPE